MKQTILIDLGNTLIYNKRISFQDGNRYLYQFLDIKTISLESFLYCTKRIIDSMFKDRNTTHMEVPFTSYLQKVIETYGVKKEIDLDELELEYYKKAVTDEAILNASDFLKFLKSKKYQIYIISNSTFSSNCLKWTLETFGMMSYIDGLYSSSDIGYRKPDKAFFEGIEILQMKDKKEMIMIGNDDYFDFEFAKNIGVDFLWYNEKYLPKKIDTFYYETHKYSDLIKEWGEKFD